MSFGYHSLIGETRGPRSRIATGLASLALQPPPNNHTANKTAVDQCLDNTIDPMYKNPVILFFHLCGPDISRRNLIRPPLTGT